MRTRLGGSKMRRAAFLHYSIERFCGHFIIINYGTALDRKLRLVFVKYKGYSDLGCGATQNLNATDTEKSLSVPK